MDYIRKILKDWGNDVPLDDDYTEFLYLHSMEHVYFIDQCPLPVDEKHNQIDIFYQEVIEGKVPKAQFMELELKYKNILTKLWLYNNVYVRTNILEVELTSVEVCIEAENSQILPKLIEVFKRDEFPKITLKKELELLVELGTRDLIDVVFYFEQFEILITPAYDGFFTYLKNLDRVNIVEKIVNVEGLYLR